MDLKEEIGLERLRCDIGEDAAEPDDRPDDDVGEMPSVSYVLLLTGVCTSLFAVMCRL